MPARVRREAVGSLGLPVGCALGAIAGSAVVVALIILAVRSRGRNRPQVYPASRYHRRCRYAQKKSFSPATPKATLAPEPTAGESPSHPSPSASAASYEAANSHLTSQAPTGSYLTVAPSWKPTNNSTTGHPPLTSPLYCVS